MTLRPALVVALFLFPLSASAEDAPPEPVEAPASPEDAAPSPEEPTPEPVPVQEHVCACDTDVGAVYAAVHPAVVRVHTREGRGNGFFIAPDRIVTAWDIADVRRDLRIETADGQMLRADLLSRSDELAVLALSEPAMINGAPPPTLSMASAPPVPGDRVLQVGRQGGVSGPLSMLMGEDCGGADWTFTDGMVSSVGDGTFQTNAAVPGGAGAPLFSVDGTVLGIVNRTGPQLSTATSALQVQQALTGEASLPKRPSLEVVHRLGAGFSRITSMDLRTGGHITLQAGWEGIIARSLLIGFDLEADLLASSLFRENEKLRSQRLLVAGRIGPRIEMPFNPAFPVPFAIHPYAQLGVTRSRGGERTETVSLVDPGCDMATEPCAVDVERGTDWTDWRWAPAFGGGLRFDMKRSYIDVGVTTNPWDTRQDTRFVVGVGMRFRALRL